MCKAGWYIGQLRCYSIVLYNITSVSCNHHTDIHPLLNIYIYYSEHVPQNIEKISAGYWVDGYEAQRLRYSLDRACLILDQVMRREKYVHFRLCLVDYSILQLSNFHYYWCIGKP